MGLRKGGSVCTQAHHGQYYPTPAQPTVTYAFNYKEEDQFNILVEAHAILAGCPKVYEMWMKH